MALYLLFSDQIEKIRKPYFEVYKGFKRSGLEELFFGRNCTTDCSLHLLSIEQSVFIRQVGLSYVH